MDKTKKSKKTVRKFVGGIYHDCGNVTWEVQTDKAIGYRTKKERWTVDAGFTISKETTAHWVNERSELAPLKVIATQLEAFIDYTERKFDEVEKENAQIKAQSKNPSS